MLEGQQFEPEGRLAQFARIVAAFERDEIEAAVDGLISLLDARDGDPDLEEAGDAELGGDEMDASFPEWRDGAINRAIRATLQHEDAEADGDEEDGNLSEDDFMWHTSGDHGPGCPFADPGEGNLPEHATGGVHTYEDDAREDDCLPLRKPHIDRIRRTRCTATRTESVYGRWIDYRLTSPHGRGFRSFAR